MKCEHCHKDNRDIAKFCRWCGSPLSAHNLLDKIIGLDEVKQQMRLIVETYNYLHSRKDIANVRLSINTIIVGETGTGKTYASAFAVKDFNPKRFLFIVHREQIAKQSINAYKNVIKDKTFGLLTGNKKDFNADYIFATIQTLSKDDIYTKFEKDEFDYIISNPPFGIEWKNEKSKVEAEHKKGDMGRFGAGLPAIGDSQQLFLLNGVAKLKDTGRMAIIQNGSPLFKGDAGSGESNIRGYLIENDWLEAIIQIPNDMFYNTGIATYIWIVTKDKSAERKDKVQLIDASKCCVKRRKSLGNKRNEFTDECINLIAQAYNEFADGVYTDNGLEVEVKIKDRYDFKYTKVVVEQPLRDEEGNLILKKNNKQPDTSKRDTETIPFKEDIEAYMQKNVFPYALDAWIDEKKSKIGYEIPFTREFYKYVAPRKSEDIYALLQELNAKEEVLMSKIMGR